MMSANEVRWFMKISFVYYAFCSAWEKINSRK